MPSPVNTAAILLFVAGGFGILGGLLFLLAGGLGAFFVLVGLIVLAIGAVEIYLGVELRRLKPWARTTAIALAGVSAALQLISMLRGGYGGIVGLALDLLVIYLLTRPESVRAFEASSVR